MNLERIDTSESRVRYHILTSRNGMRVGLSNLGARIVDLWAPDRGGNLGNVVLQGESSTDNFGATVGRFANRIGNGRICIDGQTYQLPQNDGAHTLHGGTAGFDQKFWHMDVTPSGQTVRFSRVSADGECGFPGRMEVAVTYALSEDCELRLSYEARSNKTTVVNLTNHAYFNLANAGSGDVLGHQLRIHAQNYTPTDETRIPTGEIRSVANTPFDFRAWRRIGELINQTGGDPAGYDHNFVLDKEATAGVTLAAEVYEPISGRELQVWTDRPGLQFYYGGFLGRTQPAFGERRYARYSGFCLETQGFPDAPNHPNFPDSTLRPGEIFKTHTLYKFAVRQSVLQTGLVASQEES